MNCLFKLFQPHRRRCKRQTQDLDRALADLGLADLLGRTWSRSRTGARILLLRQPGASSSSSAFMPGSDPSIQRSNRKRSLRQMVITPVAS